MPIASDGIRGLQLTREEFNLLGYIDRRHFVESATCRFQDWKSSFDVVHPDWPLRAEVQDRLARLGTKAIVERLDDEHRPLRILFTGAALGSVSTYFFASQLALVGLLKNVQLDVCDLLREPLERTRDGRFEFTTQAAQIIGYADTITPDQYKALLAKANIWQSNAVDLTHCPDGVFDMVVAPYLHHHLNLLDKSMACAELARVTKPGGLCAIGDLTFKYEDFSSWLTKHATEDVPYALECFIERTQHQELFPRCAPVSSHDGSFYYAFVLQKSA